MSSRRHLLKGLAATPLAAVLADARLASAAAQSTETVSVTTYSGATVNGALAVPDGEAKAGIVLIHEWWGLNDQIKAMAVEFAKEGYVALAADLYNGKSTTSPDEAKSIMQSVDAALATETVKTWVEWMRAHDQAKGKVATIGWCFGGGWSLNASLAAPVDATVVYYGNVQKKFEQLAALKGPVLGHYATEDKWINKAMVDGFEQSMKDAGKTVTSHWYEAQHGFANPTTARYDEEDAKLAWSRTLAFLDASLS